MKLVYLHGHGASSDSFNFIRSEVVEHDELCLEYNSRNGFAANLAEMAALLKDASGVFFIAHSLGGLYALHLAHQLGERVLGAVTMATPYGGSEAALALNLFCPQQLYKDIHPAARPITQGRSIELHAAARHWTAIVTTRGHSQLMAAANDGIVTNDSMRNRRGVRFVEVDSNHHEVVQSCESVAIIKAALRDVEELAVVA